MTTPTQSDSFLLDRFVSLGDEAAFGRLFAKYQPMVLSACLRETHDRELAEDCCAAVFLLLAERATRIDADRALVSWLFTTATLTARNAKRMENRRMKAHQTYAKTHIVPASGDEFAEMEARINQAVIKLRHSERTAVLLRFMQGLSYPEIGTKLGMGESGARMKVNRAIESLRKSLAAGGCAVSAVALVSFLENAATSAGGNFAARLPSQSARAMSILRIMSSAARIGKIKLLAFTAANVAIMGCIAVPALALQQQSPKGDGADPVQTGTVCMKRLKNIALAELMACIDNNDIISVDQAHWNADMGRYIKAPGGGVELQQLLKCPSGDGYSVNTNLFGKSINAIVDPAETVLAYDGANQKLDFHHNGKAAVAFIDGHVKLVSKEESKKLVWKIKKES